MCTNIDIKKVKHEKGIKLNELKKSRFSSEEKREKDRLNLSKS